MAGIEEEVGAADKRCAPFNPPDPAVPIRGETEGTCNARSIRFKPELRTLCC